MKKFGRVIMLVLISLLGPLVWWLGGGTERNIELGFLTFGATRRSVRNLNVKYQRKVSRKDGCTLSQVTALCLMWRNNELLPLFM